MGQQARLVKRGTVSGAQQGQAQQANERVDVAALQQAVREKQAAGRQASVDARRAWAALWQGGTK